MNTKDRTQIYKRALNLFDEAARLCRADATNESISLLANVSAALHEAQHVAFGADYRQEVARVTCLLDPIHDAIVKMKKVRAC